MFINFAELQCISATILKTRTAAVIRSGAKQKCLAHLARTAHDWQKLTETDSPDHLFFEDVKQFVKRGCAFHRLRSQDMVASVAVNCGPNDEYYSLGDYHYDGRLVQIATKEQANKSLRPRLIVSMVNEASQE